MVRDRAIDIVMMHNLCQRFYYFENFLDPASMGAFAGPFGLTNGVSAVKGTQILRFGKCARNLRVGLFLWPLSNATCC